MAGAGNSGYGLNGEAVAMDGCVTCGSARRRSAGRLCVSWDVPLASIVTFSDVLSDEDVTSDLQVLVLDKFRIVTASRDDCVRVWNSDTGVLEFEIIGSRSGTYACPPCVAWSLDGCLLARSSCDLVKVWNWETKICVFSGSLMDYTSAAWRNWGDMDRPVTALRFSPNGRCLAIAYEYGRMQLRTLGTGECVWVRTLGPVGCMSFSPDGGRIATSGALCCELTGTPYVPVWDTATGVCDIKVPLHESRDSLYPVDVCVCFSVDGQRIAITDPDYQVSIWCLAERHEILLLSGHTKTIFAVCYSTDGRRVATVSFDRTLRIWDAETGVCEHILKAHTYMISVGFSADDRRLVTCCRDGTVKIWDASTGVCEPVVIGYGEEFTSAAFQLSQ